jgi:DNA (cytosine-5)-methyltransferase 1
MTVAGQALELQTQVPLIPGLGFSSLPIHKDQTLLPTPTAAGIRNHDEPLDDYQDRRDKAQTGEYRGTPGASLGVAVRYAKDGLDWRDQSNQNETFENVYATKWGKFGPAIRRWEQITGNPAPLPTVPDGKDGEERLNADFAEWMMGLPPGWITGADVTRNDALKMAGNGVVPQQAAAAIRMLLGISLPPLNENVGGGGA